MVKIIDYKAGNAPSVMQAVRHLGCEAEFARSPQELAGATAIILPGVGSAGATMQSLNELALTRPLAQAVLEDKTPFLGVCVGLQVLFEHSEEGNVACLGWLPGRVVKFDANRVRVPQMGWNQVTFAKGVTFPTRDDYFYFVNSYHAVPAAGSDVWATAEYDGCFTAAVQRGNIFATQFHVEKSGEAGLALLGSFLRTQKEAHLC